MEYYRFKAKHFQAGQITDHIEQWRNLTSDPEITGASTLTMDFSYSRAQWGNEGFCTESSGDLDISDGGAARCLRSKADR